MGLSIQVPGYLFDQFQESLPTLLRDGSPALSM